MTKEQFLKKHNFTEKDWNNLVRFELTRQSGMYNMYEYFGIMRKNNANGGAQMVSWIQEYGNYGEFLEVYENA